MNDEPNFLNKREARVVTGIPSSEDGEYFYAERGRALASTGRIIEHIFVTRDGAGPYGLYDRVTIWDKDAVLMWEGAMHNLEGVFYA